LRPLLRRARRAVLYAAAFIWRALMFRTTFIAITGSVGKTTAKEALAAILERRGPIVKTDMSRNELTHLMRKMLSVRPWHRYAVLEVATDGPGWMKRMAWLARPHIAVILRVARTHSNRFRTLDDTAREKAVLLSTIRRGGIAVLNADDDRVAAMAALTTRRVVRFGTSPDCDVWVDQVACEFPAPLTYQAHGGNEACAVRSQLVGTHWTASLTAALTVARLLGVPLDEAAAAIARLQPVQGRMQPVLAPSGAVILRDDENGSIATLDGAFDTFRAARAERKIVVISDVADDPTKQRQRASRLGRQVASVAQVGVFLGDHAEFAVKGAVTAGMAPENVRAFVSLRDASDFLRGELRQGDLVLLKGRASDHVSRLAFAQFGEIACWVEGCAKNIECDDCGELRAPLPARSTAAAGRSRDTSAAPASSLPY
jgi:UDP-N-acetylmuramoyl-tripeptide--D-alanyl-D-alanine ligase